MTERGSDTALVDLLQRLIRNACVNDGTPESGQEQRNADLLEDYLSGCGLEFVRIEPIPGRTTLIARLPGRDRRAPSLCLMGHTDVVPVSPERWSRDPFGGELVDGHVWGRGAVDMLNQTAAQAVTLRRLVEAGFRPSGDLVFLAPADEEAGGVLGVGWIVDNEPEILDSTWLVTEGGGFHLPWMGPGSSDHPRIGVAVGEKGPIWKEMRASGTPGHASIPFRSDNAAHKVAEALTRLNSHVSVPRFDESWRDLVGSFGFDRKTAAALCDPRRVLAALEEIADEHPVEARVLHSACHTTFSANVVDAGRKINVIASEGMATLDVRTLPGVSKADVDAEIGAVLGRLADDLSISDINAQPATCCAAEGALWDAVAAATSEVLGDAEIVPWTAPFSTDARFLRPRGTIAYGATLHDSEMDLATWISLFHGDDERISCSALRNAALFYEAIVRRLLG